MNQTAANSAAAYSLDWSKPARMADEDLVTFTRVQYCAGRSRRRDWEQRALQQLAWTEGRQDTVWNEVTKRLDRLSVHADPMLPFELQNPVTINKLRGAVFQRIALLLGGEPTLLVTAESEDDDDQRAARINGKLLRYLWYNGSAALQRQIVWALWLMFITGCSWLHTFWDPDASEIEADSDAGNEPTFAGDVCVEVASGFEITEPQSVRSVERAEWLMHTKWRTMEYVLHRFGDAAEALAPGIGFAENAEDALFQRSLYDWDADSEDVRSAPEEMVQLHCLWRPARPWCPQGFYGVISGDGKVLAKGPHPYRYGLSENAPRLLPFTLLTEIPGRTFRPPSTVANLMNLQESRNRMRSQAAAHIHKTVAPKNLVEKTAEIPADAFNSEANIIPCAEGTIAGRKVAPWPGNPFPGQVLAMDELYRRDFDDVAGVHDSTVGRPTSSQQSGRHAALLLQADARGNLVTQRIVQDAIVRAAQQALWLFYHHVGTERTVTISGSSDRSEVLTYKGQDLLGRKRSGHLPGPFAFNVRVTLGPDLGQAEVLDKIESMTKLGYWSPQRDADRQMVLSLIGHPSPLVRDAYTQQIERAAVENEELADGRSVEPVIGDDDDVHLSAHDRFTTTDEYRRAVAKDPNIAELFVRHRERHVLQRADKKFRPVIVEQMTAKLLQVEVQRALQLAGQADWAGTGGRLAAAPLDNQGAPMPPSSNGAATQRGAGLGLMESMGARLLG